MALHAQPQPSGADGAIEGRKVRIAIVGLNFGRHIARALRGEPLAKLYDVAGVCDLDAARARQIADECGTGVYRSLDAILADPHIDAVGLFTAPAGRAGLIRQIIGAGKDVMTTKPFEDDPDAAAEVLAEAQRLGRFVHLNSPTPVMPVDLQQVLDWRDQFDLGRPVGCRLETYASYHEQADGSWLDDPQRCPAAPIFRLGIYLINDVIRLFGEPEAVQVLESRIRTGRPTSDNAQLTIRFRNGALANIFCSFCIGDTQHYRNVMAVNYERGTVYRNVGPSHQHSSMAEMAVVTPEPGAGRPHIEQKVLPTCSGQYQWDQFHRAVTDRAAGVHTDPHLVAMGLKVVVAMARATRSGCVERV